MSSAPLDPPAVRVSPLIRVSMIVLCTKSLECNLSSLFFRVLDGLLWDQASFTEQNTIVSNHLLLLIPYSVSHMYHYHTTGSLKQKEDEHRAYIAKMKPIWMEQKNIKKKALERGKFHGYYTFNLRNFSIRGTFVLGKRNWISHTSRFRHKLSAKQIIVYRQTAFMSILIHELQKIRLD